MLLIDEMKAHLPITAYASRHLSKALIANGFDVTIKRKGSEKSSGQMVWESTTPP